MTVPKTGVLPITPWAIRSKEEANLKQSLVCTNIFDYNNAKSRFLPLPKVDKPSTTLLSTDHGDPVALGTQRTYGQFGQEKQLGLGLVKPLSKIRKHVIMNS